MRNPHAGAPFDDSDEVLAATLGLVNAPALLCSLVHMTGDASWIDRQLPLLPMATDYQCGLTAEDRAEILQQALPAIRSYRDGGCEPAQLSDDVLRRMMEFLAKRRIDERVAAMFFEDMQFAGGDSRAITWGGEIADDVKAASPVVVIGFGLSGILAGIRLTQAGLPFTIIEKNDGPGGTWWENRYPGARVDVGSHQYCYSFEPSGHWSEYYCQYPELQRYFASVAAKYGLLPHCRFNTTVTATVWDEAAARWHVTTEDSAGHTEVLDARFVVSAVGSLNLPRLPDIAGRDDFAGRSFHSSRWPADLDITGTRFALVGAGASGFQIAPSIADTVEQLTIYQRTPQWMMANPIYRQPVPDAERWALQHLPFYARWFRFMMTFPGVSVGTAPYRIDPDYHGDDPRAINPLNEARGQVLERWIRSQLDGREDLIELSVPNYPSSGKRLLQDDGYWLQGLRKPNVDLVRTDIECIVPDGIITADGIHRPADIICFATGFQHNDFLAPMHVVGRNGVDLRTQWGKEPTAYLGIHVPNFPNFFCLYGPGTNLAHSSSLFFHSEFQMSHAMEAIRLALTSGARAVEVDHAVHDRYAQWHQSEISQLVWAHPSIRHSHYKNPDGKVFTLSPWPIDQYWELTAHLDPADFALS
jgi:4-hydroxyacetophenone monooxygenase